ncbi:uncharacterized protein LOC125234186 [Leguminivora glycinivorella]|uniref:uncharacterized protein LOC125234186 n=1 Tax=Leguminivora glycinivorella TaxID=1035111 RepID=UPI00200C2491|nr:uncharacterized protein LOC125234186 [Leguminivora glycinivorella]
MGGTPSINHMTDGLKWVIDVRANRQYAYRAGRSTTELVREVVWDVLRAREAALQVAVVCCDLSRAFDTADHRLIARKLEHYGVCGPALALLLSFMSDRCQVVVIKGSSIYMYADDVTAVVTGTSHEQLETNVNSTLQQLSQWFHANGLALNKSKTSWMKFKLNGHAVQPTTVCAGDDAVQQVTETKLLGFTIDSGLLWDTHIDQLCAKLGSACFALKRLASTATGDVVRSCYFATVHAYIAYGTELWATAADWHRTQTVFLLSSFTAN